MEAKIIFKSLEQVDNQITYNQKRDFLEEIVNEFDDSLKKVLFIPPDFTRFHSNGGEITQILFELINEDCQKKILPALGTHSPLSDEEISVMFGKIPKKHFIVHDWRNEVVKVGTIPSEFIKELSEDKLNYSINVEINKEFVKENYDLIISIGQVVPHEVAGMANGNKNVLVGVGGRDMINKSHFLSACYGMERLIGKTDNPVRHLFTYAESIFLKEIPLLYILTVVSANNSGNVNLKGLYTSNDNRSFEKAAKLSQKINLTFLKDPISKIVVYLDPKEFKSTWLGNKAIYRTRMALEDNGDLIILAPGLKQFGEDDTIDQIIRRYGYRTSTEIIAAVKKNEDLQQNLSAAAHLIHGSSENRFNITYCPGHIKKNEIEGINYQYSDLFEALNVYNPTKLIEGFNRLPDKEEIFFIRNPAMGLWTVEEKFMQM
ncbi:MAG: lactate racemase domain-containing protein [Promethearchaeota archaeon]